MAVDPIKSGLNWYSYVDNSPTNFYDLRGLYDIPAGLNKDYIAILQAKFFVEYMREHSNEYGAYGNKTKGAIENAGYSFDDFNVTSYSELMGFSLDNNGDLDRNNEYYQRWFAYTVGMGYAPKLYAIIKNNNDNGIGYASIDARKNSKGQTYGSIRSFLNVLQAVIPNLDPRMEFLKNDDINYDSSLSIKDWDSEHQRPTIMICQKGTNDTIVRIVIDKDSQGGTLAGNVLVNAFQGTYNGATGKYEDYKQVGEYFKFALCTFTYTDNSQSITLVNYDALVKCLNLEVLGVADGYPLIGETKEESSTDTNAMIADLDKDTSLGLSNLKKKTIIGIGRTMLDEGYEPAFVAGMLANIIYEGAAGHFESSVYISNPQTEPDYFKYMYKNYDYRNKYSGKNIYDGMSLSNVNNMLQQIEKAGFNAGSTNGDRKGFGLGSVQWTFGRTKTLVETYIEVANGSDTITFEQTLHAEGLMISRELSGYYNKDYSSIYPDWKANNATKLSSSDAAYNAGVMLCKRYERPQHDSSSTLLHLNRL
jgi:hypothetical protein